jgi:hypothetical protein
MYVCTGRSRPHDNESSHLVEGARNMSSPHVHPNEGSRPTTVSLLHDRSLAAAQTLHVSLLGPLASLRSGFCGCGMILAIGFPPTWRLLFKRGLWTTVIRMND